MQLILKLLVLLALSLCGQFIQAQDTIPNIEKQKVIERLENLKSQVKADEKDKLKEAVIAINNRFQNAEITNEESDKLKKEAAEKAALNIENRIAIIDNRIALINRNDYELEIQEEKQNLIGLNISNRTFNVKTQKTPVKYDIKTGNQLLFAIGFNNAIIEGEKLDDSPYKFGGSGFVEIGWLWQTRLLKESPFLRLEYGLSFQWNKLNPVDNQYFVENGNVTSLETYPIQLKKSKFRVTNLVFPVHVEFGPMRKLDREDRLRYVNNNKFKMGLGGYGGFNLRTKQKLKYSDDGRSVKDKQKNSFNTSNLVYGLSGYVGFGDTALYVKYDLSPIFKNQQVNQNNISVGLRFDID
ncbi:hypothetical protein [Aestuariibaculum sediminum]|uniref:Outer membrane protein beta-barrel domain-containing protein n=1 Tax=Aestuariibaculum sediminum TaxID=2770637 RepID=A0A8J6Q2Z7_9FLAO|nr:hypothetical protein [Aestuariibaculum sediminum]MBD0832864.1 hypothetical protein [Aestuariibaculum sediminum]